MGQIEMWISLEGLLIILVGFVGNRFAEGDCPASTKQFHRLGQTRYFIYDNAGFPDKKMDVAWSEAPNKCKKLSNDAKVASSLDKISTNAIIARYLEKLAAKLSLKETVYWIGAKYDSDTKAYRWIKDNHSPGNYVDYSNFHYEQPRPAGIGVHSLKGSTLPQHNFWNTEEKCLAFALPFKNNPNLGWQASWAEKICNSGKHRRVLCESTSSQCNNEEADTNPHLLTEDKEYYFIEGNWIFANRKFIVNWKPRTFKEAKSYCEEFGLVLYAPMLGDDCLIPYLKMWTPVLSTYHFWTSYKYHAATEDFRDKDNKVVQRGVAKLKGRSTKNDELFCVSYVWSFEFKNETRCKHFKCDWAYYMLAPSNCENKIGTICEHKEEDNTRVCNFQKDWLRDFTPGLIQTAVVEFGYKGSGFWRSTYKQKFGSRVCGSSERQMIGITTDYWSVDREGVDFLYDYYETYWIVDDELFANVGSDEELCSVSEVVWNKETKKNERTIEKVPCNEWYFYLCELVA